MYNYKPKERVICPRCGGSYVNLSLHMDRLSCRKKQEVVKVVIDSFRKMGERGHFHFRYSAPFSGYRSPSTTAVNFFTRNNNVVDSLGFVLVPNNTGVPYLTTHLTGPKAIIDWFSLLSLLASDRIRKLDTLTTLAVTEPDSGDVQAALVTAVSQIDKGFGLQPITYKDLEKDYDKSIDSFYTPPDYNDGDFLCTDLFDYLLEVQASL